ncbi:porin family protein [Pontibacter cellulosilyticus]|uniref:PorT family protein n=1 Tax=Pontibacter cellulosilyticus TaxID=1720253 RepID=A0A923SJP2_9BACT|nr:porin family protein [Pontibacter cellulosilyticus]MBC5994104.1 PorT family protein [Pontibacter cellulosilyticus]
MKQTLHTAILIFALILTGVAAQAQKSIPNAYIVTAASDTLRGQLIRESATKTVTSIQFGEPGNFRTYQAADIKGYGVEDSIRFESKEVTVGSADKTVFLRLVVDGPVKLYSGSGIEEGVEFYLQKPNSPVIQLYKAYYKGTVSSVASDCDILQSSYQGSLNNLPRYTALSLADFVQKYSACKYIGQESKVYLNQSKISISYGFRALLSSSNLQLDSDLSDVSDSFNRDNKLFGGIFLNIHMAGKRLSVQPEILYTQYNFESVYEYQHPIALDYKNTFTYKTTQLQVPLLLKYTFRANRIQPIVNAGPSISFLLSNNIKKTTTYETGQVNAKDYNDANRSVGYLGGAGLQYSLSDKKALILELRYSKDFYNNENDDMRAIISNYQVSAAITL